MTENTQSRKWQITINNPIEKGFTHEKIQELLSKFKSLVYYCLADEIGGETQTFHTHIYIAFSSGVRFSSLLKKFQGGHFEMANGTSEQNRDYVFKQGKWKNTEKETTNIADSHVEFGEMPVERQGKRNDLDDLYDMIKSGLSNYEIIETCPQYMLCVDKIERCRQIIQEEKYKDSWRNVEVTYISGVTGTGKTRGVMELYGYSNCYRVTDYLHPFDSYKGQDVVIFEEFRSSLKIDDMLKYLDGYPVEFPARYANKIACFTKVYIISNIDLEKQYPNVQNEEKETYEAFLRRINNVMIYTDYKVYTYTKDLYFSDFRYCSVVPKEFLE